jgi:tetratricopeptide (TPR) repeat protein
MNIYDKIIKWVVYLSVFLVPLFFLPFSFELFETNKSYLVFFLVLVGTFVWLAKMVLLDKEVKFKRTPLDIPVLVLVLVAILSTIFSNDGTASFFGAYGRFSTGLISFLSMAVFYFLVTNNPVKISGIIKSFVYSSAVVTAVSYFSISGILEKIGKIFKFLPAFILQRNFNPVAAYVDGLAIFLSIFLVFLVGIILTQKFGSKKKEIFYWLLALAVLGLLLIIDFASAWIVMVIAFLALVVFSLINRIFKEDVNKLLLPIALIIISVVFLFFNLPKNSLNSSLAGETILSQSQSWSIALKTVTSDIKSVFLGSGPGTFSLDFSKFKSADFNKTNLWQYRFDRPASNLSEILATTGFLGLLAQLALIVMFFLASFKMISAKLNAQLVKVQGSNINQLSLIFNPQLAFLSVFVALLVGQLVFYQNMTLMLLFWLILAVGLIDPQKNPKELKYSFRDFPEIGLIFGVVLIAVAIGFSGLSFFGARFYLADVAYFKAVTATTESALQSNLEKAVAFNPYQVQYKMTLSNLYLNQALSEAAKSADQQDSQKAQNSITKAIDLARSATEISAKDASTWTNRGLLYSQIGSLVSGAADWAIKSFQEAASLDPSNPVYYTELGKLLLTTNKDEAKKEFAKALELKPDYADAVLQQSLILEQEGKKDEAIKSLENFVRNNPYNTDILFQLGRFYYNNNLTEDAATVFQYVILLSPNHSNAHYALGVIYAAQDNKKLALAEFKKVLELNPGNQDVIDKIKSLE